MNALRALMNCAVIGFIAGFLASAGPNLGDDLLALTSLMAIITTLLILLEVTNQSPQLAAETI